MPGVCPYLSSVVPPARIFHYLIEFAPTIRIRRFPTWIGRSLTGFAPSLLGSILTYQDFPLLIRNYPYLSKFTSTYQDLPFHYKDLPLPIRIYPFPNRISPSLPGSPPFLPCRNAIIHNFALCPGHYHSILNVLKSRSEISPLDFDLCATF